MWNGGGGLGTSAGVAAAETFSPGLIEDDTPTLPGDKKWRRLCAYLSVLLALSVAGKYRAYSLDHSIDKHRLLHFFCKSFLLTILPSFCSRCTIYLDRFRSSSILLLMVSQCRGKIAVVAMYTARNYYPNGEFKGKANCVPRIENNRGNVNVARLQWPSTI